MNKYLVSILSLFCVTALSAMDLDLERVKLLSLQEQEDMQLAKALALSLEDKNKQKNFDSELARQLQQEEEQQLKKEQEERDRLLALSLQQESDIIIQNKPKVKSIAEQLQEYRKRQSRQAYSNLIKVESNRMSTLTNNLPLPRQAQDERARLKYTPFNRNLGSQLHLPGVTGKLKLPGIYHVLSDATIPKQKGWACTFHALYNACKIEEQFLGKKVNNDLFIKSCALASEINVSGSNLEVHAIAEALKLSHLAYLTLENNTILTLPRSGTISYAVRQDRYGNALDTPAQIKQKQSFAKMQLTSEMWNNCKNRLKRSGVQCLHFIGSILSHNTPHGVLLSVVKMSNGSKALYIFDNMNKNEDMYAQEQIRVLAEHVYKKLMQ